MTIPYHYLMNIYIHYHPSHKKMISMLGIYLHMVCFHFILIIIKLSWFRWYKTIIIRTFNTGEPKVCNIISKSFQILNKNIFRLEIFKAIGDIDHPKSTEKLSTSTSEQKTTRKTTTLKYSAKKISTEQQQRSKTVDIVRLKAGKYYN